MKYGCYDSKCFPYSGNLLVSVSMGVTVIFKEAIIDKLYNVQKTFVLFASRLLVCQKGLIYEKMLKYSSQKQ